MMSMTKNDLVNRISFKEYKNGLFSALGWNIIFMVSAIIPIVTIRYFFILSSGVFVLYLLYYTNKRICHAVINKLLIIPFIIIYNFYIFFVTEIYILYVILALILYILFIILLAKYLPNYIKPKKYIFNNEKYRRLADFCDISKPMYKILFFKFKAGITRKEYFSIIIFLIIVNAFIFYDYSLLYDLRDYMYYELDYKFYIPDDFSSTAVIVAYLIILLYLQFIIFFARLTSIFGTIKYHILIFIFLGVLLHFFCNYISLDFAQASYVTYFLIAGIIPPKKEDIGIDMDI